MAVTLISEPDELAPDSAQGVVVLVSDDPGSVATAVAERMGCAPPCTPADAVDRLVAHEQDAAGEPDGAPRSDDPARDYDQALQQAREEAAEAWSRVPPASRGVDPQRLRAAAAAVTTAGRVVDDARALLGERPDLAADAAQAAMAAEEAVVRAHQERATGIDRASTLLLTANAVGVLIVAGRVRTPVVEPLFVFVAALPLTALAYLTATVISRTRATRVALRCRSRALQKTGMATMTGLIARHARVKAWSARADALAAAEASLAQARRRWARLGGHTPTGEVDSLADALAEARHRAAVLAELEENPITATPDPPAHLVILLDGAADAGLDDEARALLERLDQLDGTGVHPATIVVSASGEVHAWAARRAEGTAGGAEGTAGAQVVDIRERVLASMERLRARAAGFADTPPPGPMAADG